MRRRKHKQISRTLRFFRIQRDFRPPFKILADGNFLVALENMKCGDSGWGSEEAGACTEVQGGCRGPARASGLVCGLRRRPRWFSPCHLSFFLLSSSFFSLVPRQGTPEQVLGRLLGASVRVFVTPCVRAELRRTAKELDSSVDEATRDALFAASHSSRELALHACGHEASHLPADECISEQLFSGSDGGAGGSSSAAAALGHTSCNPEHWFVATQDRALQSRCAATTAVPVVFATANGVRLHELDAAALDAAERALAARSALSDAEARAAARAARQVLVKAGVGDAALKNAPLRAKPLGAVETSVKFRKGKAKGPNPLSMRKKDRGKESGKATAGPDGGIKKHARKRRGGKNAEAGDDAQQRATTDA